jgi:hypothetical protein
VSHALLDSLPEDSDLIVVDDASSDDAIDASSPRWRTPSPDIV